MRIRPIHFSVLCFLTFCALIGCTAGSDNNSTCTDGDQTYASGDTWTCSDGCNECSCGENGSIASTDLDCSGFCSDEDCGPAPGMPNYLCDDGKPQPDRQDVSCKTPVNVDGPLFSALQPTHATT